MTDIAPKNDRLVWIDLEMTGLDPKRHVIVEVAAIITDGNLNVIGEGIDLVVHATEAELAEMDDFVTNMHANSGLDKEIRESTTTLREAEDAVLALIAEHCNPEHPAPWQATPSPPTAPSFAPTCHAWMKRCTTA